MNISEFRDADPRNRHNGLLIPRLSYCDQPYIVVTGDGDWVCTMTTGKGVEGAPGQHIIATVSHDQGRNWSPPVAIEDESGPEASWVTPMITPYGRIYAFYTFNGDNVTTLPGAPGRVRSDTHGWYAFKYSDDGGFSWSQRRFRIPMPIAEVDRRNPWGGSVCHFWGIDKPKEQNGSVYFAFTRLGRFFMQDGEGWVVSSPNLLTERDPERLEFRLLPENGLGIRDRKFEGIQEEHNLLPIGGEDWLCVCRTQSGFALESYSRDAGRSWSTPEPMRYSPNGRIIRTPRACPKLFDAGMGRFLFWYHHDSYTSWGGRNPVFLTGGRRAADGTVHWSEPELILFDSIPSCGMSYPDMIVDSGDFFVTETNKVEARTHILDPVILAGLWSPPEHAADGALSETANFGGLENGGWSIEIGATALPAGTHLLEKRDSSGVGVRIVMDELAGGATVKIEFSDGVYALEWSSDPGRLVAGAKFHAVFVADFSVGIISIILNGEFCDGSGLRPWGWGRIPNTMNGTANSTEAKKHPAMSLFRLYDRPLRTAEAVGCHRSWLRKKA